MKIYNLVCECPAIQYQSVLMFSEGGVEKHQPRTGCRKAQSGWNRIQVATFKQDPIVHRKEGLPEQDVGSLRVMGWGLEVVGIVVAALPPAVLKSQRLKKL